MRRIFFLFLLVYLYIFGVLLNYENAWMHPEIIERTGLFLKEHTETNDRWAQVFNWHLWEGEFAGKPCTRARFFSHALLTANALFRNWLFQFIPPHPSLSLTWIFTLFLAPYFLYRLMRNLIDDKESSLLTSLIYLALPGTLIPIIMLFHAGKPMSNFLYIFCLYLGSVIYKNMDNLPPSLFKRKFLLLVVTILFSLFFDEYCLFIWVLIPIFYPRLFTGRYRLYVYGLYGWIPLFYFLSVIYFLPTVYTFLGHPGFNILSFIDINKGFPSFNPFYTLINFILLLHDNLQAGLNTYLKDSTINVTITKFLSVTNRLEHADNIRIGLSLLNERPVTFWQVIHNLLTLAVFILLPFAVKQSGPNRSAARTYFVKSTLALFGYTVFFSYLHTSNNIISGCGWYGCNFSILFAIWIGLTLHIVRQAFPRRKVVVYLFIVTLIGHALWNTRLLNHAWLVLHRHRGLFFQTDLWLNKISRRELYEKYYIPKEKNNFLLTLQAWQTRRDPEAVKSILKYAYPEVRAYLYNELPYIP